MNQKPKVIVICGPTASGKTGLSIELAKAINGEIVSCDSMQIYQDMNIGTAKPTQEEKQAIPHYIMDFVPPTKRYSVADFKKDAVEAIEEILAKGKVPIVVGGTGLYVNALVDNITYTETKIDLEYRKKLEQQIEEQGLESLYEQAKKIDPEAITKISKNDSKRILRILEIYHQTGLTKTEQEIESKKIESPYQYIILGINMERQKLYNRINLRVNLMIEQGLIQEVQDIVKKYKEFPTAMQGLGYKEVIPYLEEKITKEEMIEKIQMETRRYAKRQMTWFRKREDICWIDAEMPIEDKIAMVFEKYNS